MWNNSRRYLIILLASLFSSVSVGTKAQEGDPRAFQMGFKAGLNASQIWGDGYAGFNKIGGYAGFSLSQEWKPQWKWSFEMLYHNKGSVQPPKNGNLFHKIALHYVEVPLLINYTFNNYDKFSIEAGAIAGYLFSQRYGISRGQTFPYVNPPFNALEVGVFFGGLYQYSDKLSFVLRSQRSVTRIAGNLATIRPGTVIRGVYNLNLSAGFVRRS